MDNWDKYGIHVLKSLERIEEKLGIIEAAGEKHVIDDLNRFDAVDQKLAKIEKDVKWHAKIAAGVGSFFVIVIGWIIGLRNG